MAIVCGQPLMLGLHGNAPVEPVGAVERPQGLPEQVGLVTIAQLLGIPCRSGSDTGVLVYQQLLLGW